MPRVKVVNLRLPYSNFCSEKARVEEFHKALRAVYRAKHDKYVRRDYLGMEVGDTIREIIEILDKNQKARIVLIVTGGKKDKHDHDVYRREVASAIAHMLAARYKLKGHEIIGSWPCLSKKLDRYVYNNEKFGVQKGKAFFLARIRMEPLASVKGKESK